MVTTRRPANARMSATTRGHRRGGRVGTTGMADLGGSGARGGAAGPGRGHAQPRWPARRPRGNYFQRSEVKAALVGRAAHPGGSSPQHPEHRDAAPIERPVFVMGLPRHRHHGAAPRPRTLHPTNPGLEMWLTRFPQPRPPRGTLGGGPGLRRRCSRRSRRTTWRARVHGHPTTWMRPRSRSAWRPLRQTGKSNSYGESLARTCRATPSGCGGQDWTDAYARHKQNSQLVGLNDPEQAVGAEEPAAHDRAGRA